MSTNIQPAALPESPAARDLLFQRVYDRVFFHKLASAGLQPRNSQQATWQLETAAKLREISESAQTKQAAAAEDPFYQMNAAVDALMTQQGLGGTPAREVDLAVKAAADELAGDPEIYNAVLAVKADEAELIRRQFAA